MTGDLRRELILSAAKRCFARNGFAGTTTKSVAVAAGISEALLFKHFPSKAALYATILADECDADPALHHLLRLPPSTATLVILVRAMVAHFAQAAREPDGEEAQKLRLFLTSRLEDNDFARVLEEKIFALLGPTFTQSLDCAVASGDAEKTSIDAATLFWFVHNANAMTVLTTSADAARAASSAAEEQFCEFVLRGMGLKSRVIADHLARDMPAELIEPTLSPAQTPESA